MDGAVGACSSSGGDIKLLTRDQSGFGTKAGQGWFPLLHVNSPFLILTKETHPLKGAINVLIQVNGYSWFYRCGCTSHGPTTLSIGTFEVFLK